MLSEEPHCSTNIHITIWLAAASRSFCNTLQPLTYHHCTYEAMIADILHLLPLHARPKRPNSELFEHPFHVSFSRGLQVNARIPGYNPLPAALKHMGTMWSEVRQHIAARNVLGSCFASACLKPLSCYNSSLITVLESVLVPGISICWPVPCSAF